MATIIMDYLVIRTGLPFGYMVAGLGLLLLAALGVAMGLGHRRRPSRWLGAAGAGLLAVIGLIAAASLRAEAIDWNPRVQNEHELVGEWRSGDAVLTIERGGRFRCVGPACTEIGVQGVWSWNGSFDVSFGGASEPRVQWRLAARDGRLHLAAGVADEDPDLWRPRLMFTRVASAT